MYLCLFVLNTNCRMNHVVQVHTYTKCNAPINLKLNKIELCMQKIIYTVKIYDDVYTINKNT